MSDSQSATLDLALLLVLTVIVLKLGVPKFLAAAFSWHQPPSLTWNPFGGSSSGTVPGPISNPDTGYVPS